MGATRPTAFFFFDFLPPAEDVEAEERDADDFFAFLSFFFFLAIAETASASPLVFKLRVRARQHGRFRKFKLNSKIFLNLFTGNMLLGRPSTQYLGTYLAGRLSTEASLSLSRPAAPLPFLLLQYSQ